ncbi:centromere protein I-like [Arctopsyche grandis]|uniref:centromere protein I-like n=1 Tax=Arctopsyche grandis TaxID=121162 RepID=UPI00406D7A5B
MSADESIKGGECVEWLRDAVLGGGGSRDSRVKAVLQRMEQRAALGLRLPLLRALASFWLENHLTPKNWSFLGNCIIPEKNMPDDVVRNVIHWIQCNYYNAENTSKVVYALSWLQGVMEYNLVNMDILDIYYEFFFYLLNFDKFSGISSKFVYMLTKPQDVTRTRVLLLLKLTKIERLSRHYNSLIAVINLFKGFKPEYVPENVPIVSVNTVFPKINKTLALALQRAQVRCNIQTALDSETRLVWWKPTSSNSGQSKSFLIPNVEYIHLGSSLYSKDSKTCIDFQNARDLMVYNIGQAIDIPANILSVLINDAGMHLLMFADKSLQSRFSYNLYQILYNNYLKKTTFTYEEKKVFLRRIVTLQNYLLQGIPIVSRFLAIFISNWNGHDFLDEILSLLEWITFDTFEELYDCILENIETLYLTNNVYYQCSIVNMLKRMYVRIHRRMTLNRKPFFQCREVKYDSFEILTNLTDFMADLCEKSSQNIYGSAILRNAFLDAYLKIGELQTNCSQPLWSVAPRSLTYGILCSFSGFSINRMLELILKYDTIYEKVKLQLEKDEIEDRIELSKSYSTDYCNCLWLGESIKSRKQGVLLNMVPIELIEIMESDVEECDVLLDIGHHVAFSTYTYMQFPHDMADLDKSLLLEMAIPSYFPNISKFIEKVPKGTEWV